MRAARLDILNFNIYMLILKFIYTYLKWIYQ